MIYDKTTLQHYSIDWFGNLIKHWQQSKTEEKMWQDTYTHLYQNKIEVFYFNMQSKINDIIHCQIKSQKFYLDICTYVDNDCKTEEIFPIHLSLLIYLYNHKFWNMPYPLLNHKCLSRLLKKLNLIYFWN